MYYQALQSIFQAYAAVFSEYVITFSCTLIVLTPPYHLPEKYLSYKLLYTQFTLLISIIKIKIEVIVKDYYCQYQLTKLKSYSKIFKGKIFLLLFNVLLNIKYSINQFHSYYMC